MGPRPAPELYTKTVEDDGVLELVPEWMLFTTRSGADGLPETIAPSALHRYCFRARVEGDRLRLVQEPDRHGAKRPFTRGEQFLWSEDEMQQPIWLSVGTPVVIAYNVPGGGPQWTLTLLSITPI
jgi:hypothetical protein